ncbi:Slit-like proteinprotein, partial [Stegodyphus mimosarum]
MHIAIILIAILPLALCCPPADSLYPCICKEFDSVKTLDIICEGLDNIYDLRNSAAACKKRSDIRNFRIINSVFNFIPQFTFNESLFTTLEVKDSTMYSISNTEKAFRGLEKTLHTLVLINSTFFGLWNWSKLRLLTKIHHLMVSGNGFQSIEKDIENINFVKGLDLSKNDISWIYAHAFEKFKDLSYLILANNEIKELKRSMLPNPGPVFRFINLRQNHIQTLPVDMFQNMPKLDTFLISGNHILTLDERTFSAAWNQLAFIDLDDNDLRCD